MILRRGWRHFLLDLFAARRTRLPMRVALFYARVGRIARHTGDEFTLAAMTKAHDLGTLLGLASGRRRVVEIGTGAATTSIALALADRERQIWTYDVKARRQAQTYLRIAPASVRERITFCHESGAEPSRPPSAVDLVFIDGSHEREDTAATFRAWEKQLAPDGVVVFHDYGSQWVGVAQAVDDLRLKGKAEGLLFAWSRQSLQTEHDPPSRTSNAGIPNCG
jgi:predicted O-methyltransferase YrrM